MEKIGLVKSIEGSEAIVEIRRASACGENCASCKGGCTPTAIYVRVNNHLNASIGQYVKLHSENKRVMKVAFLVYIIPLLSMIVGIAIGLWVAIDLGYEEQQELIGAGIGFVFLALSYIFLRLKDNSLKEGKDMEITISHIIN